MTDVVLPVLRPPFGEGRRPGAAESDRRRIAEALSALIEGEVRFGRHDRMLYATDASIYQVEPLGVVVPRSVGDVEATVRLCAEEGLPLLPRGGGTSLAGQAVNRAVVIDFSPGLGRLLEVDVARRRARVQPGLVLDDLNRALAPHGLAFGPDVATSTHATLGGMIGNNSAGAHSVLYGRTVEHLVGVDLLTAAGDHLRLDRGAAERDERVRALTQRVADVVIARAEIIDRRYPRTRRRVNGYNLDLVLAQLRACGPGRLDEVNLAHLVCGAEGTLGVTVEAELALVAAPPTKGLAIVAFPDVDAALAAVAGVLETGPAAVELVDEVIIGLAARNLEHRRAVELLPAPPEGRAGAVLYVEYFADGPVALAARFEALETRCAGGGVRRYEDAASMAAAWRLRKAGEPLLHGQPGPRKPVTFIEDTAVEPSRLPEFVRRFRRIVAAHGTTASYYAHASVGCLHIRPMICLTDAEDVRTMREIVAEVTDLVLEFGGALSGEHGDGRLRSHLLERFYGPELCAAFREIRALFDPDGRMNPGNITDPASMTEHLRVRPDARTVAVPDVRTFFRYEREHGFGGAVEMCNGAGVCRKTVGGTMCPSYRATRDERHATRGRGNALRLAITGQLAADGRAPDWSDRETLATLDLCLSCKACKSECPSNVDIARLKAEYLAQGYARSVRVPLRARVFGHVRTLNRLGSVLPRLATAAAGSRPLRALADRLLGLDPRRSLPPFGPSLHGWHRGRRPGLPPDARAVVLFPDCFTTYGEPRIGRAAIRVLETLGYRVVLPPVGCCGRSLISTGLLGSAVATCRATARGLEASVGQSGAVAVVGCEPSCVSAITDDWLDLDLGLDVRALRGLAARTFLVEDFVEEVLRDEPGRRPTSAARPGAPVVLHGHCHQKALGDTEATARLLAGLLGTEIDTLDIGCCGMAGSFGFGRDHYDLSMRVAELALFPALRARPDARVAAPGTSCRHQIRDGLGRRAWHPIELAAEALGLPAEG